MNRKLGLVHNLVAGPAVHHGLWLGSRRAARPRSRCRAACSARRGRSFAGSWSDSTASIRRSGSRCDPRPTPRTSATSSTSSGSTLAPRDPDILQVDAIWTPEFAAAGWILPLDRYAPDTAAFFPVTIEANRWQGELFALPWFVDVGMLYWRTDLFRPGAPDLGRARPRRASRDRGGAHPATASSGRGPAMRGWSPSSSSIWAASAAAFSRAGASRSHHAPGVRALTTMREPDPPGRRRAGPRPHLARRGAAFRVPERRGGVHAELALRRFADAGQRPVASRRPVRGGADAGGAGRTADRGVRRRAARHQRLQPRGRGRVAGDRLPHAAGADARAREAGGAVPHPHRGLRRSRARRGAGDSSGPGARRSSRPRSPGRSLRSTPSSPRSCRSSCTVRSAARPSRKRRSRPRPAEMQALLDRVGLGRRRLARR